MELFFGSSFIFFRSFIHLLFLVIVAKALQDFDLALRGKKKRAQFLKQGKKKELTVRLFNQTLFFSSCFYELLLCITVASEIKSALCIESTQSALYEASDALLYFNA